MTREIGKLLLVLALALMGDWASGRVLVRGAGLLWFVFTAIVFALGVRWAFQRGHGPNGGAGAGAGARAGAGSSRSTILVVGATILYGVGGHLLRPSGQEALLISVESTAIALLSGLAGLVMLRH
jgi:hypothetical protein